jgi:hypothetical protein
MKRACREIAETRYSMRAMCESYWDVFTGLLERRT